MNHRENCGVHHAWCAFPNQCALESEVAKLKAENERLGGIEKLWNAGVRKGLLCGDCSDVSDLHEKIAQLQDEVDRLKEHEPPWCEVHEQYMSDRGYFTSVTNYPDRLVHELKAENERLGQVTQDQAIQAMTCAHCSEVECDDAKMQAVCDHCDQQPGKERDQLRSRVAELEERAKHSTSTAMKKRLDRQRKRAEAWKAAALLAAEGGHVCHVLPCKMPHCVALEAARRLDQEGEE